MNILTDSFFDNDIVTENQQIFLPVLEDKKVELFIKREDLIHPLVSGNKFRKLKYNITEAKKLKKKSLLTFGGAFSNHIVATAVAGKLNGLKTFGVIRGDELGLNIKKTLEENATLRTAHENGMKFHFVSRELYRQKSSFGFIEKMKNEWGSQIRSYVLDDRWVKDLRSGYKVHNPDKVLLATDKPSKIDTGSLARLAHINHIEFSFLPDESALDLASVEMSTLNNYPILNFPPRSGGKDAIDFFKINNLNPFFSGTKLVLSNSE